MKSTNIGIANLIISNKLKESYFNQDLVVESKKLTTDFFDVVKNSPILQLEFKVFDNLEKKHIDGDLAATRYIDSNIKLFEVYTISEIDIERNKLNKFLDKNIILDTNKTILYNAIDNLIRESLNDYDDMDTDVIHESFEIVLNHIKSPKKQLIESHEVKPMNEEVIEIAINKFNEKYSTLNEDDRVLIKMLVKSNEGEKNELLEEYKNECLTILESKNNDKIADKIATTIKKIREMSYNSKTIDDNIISLHEFKKELL